VENNPDAGGGSVLSQRQTLEITGREQFGDSVFFMGRILYGEAALHHRDKKEIERDKLYKSYSAAFRFPDSQEGPDFFQSNPQSFNLDPTGYWYFQNHVRDSRKMATVEIAGETLFLEYRENYVVRISINTSAAAIRTAVRKPASSWWSSMASPSIRTP
jgi:hypothetical protein